jgi:hypothetical protein
VQAQPSGQQDGQAGESDQPEENSGELAGYDLTNSSKAESQDDENETPEVQWEASEYIHHDRGVLWFVALGAVVLVLGGLAFWLKAWTFLGLLVVMVAALVVYTHRPPRTLSYSLSMHGLNIDGKRYHYEEFKAFGIQHDGVFYSIVLIPIKRFMPAVTMFFDHNDGEGIVDILGTHLPMQEMEPDFMDQVLRKLRL